MSNSEVSASAPCLIDILKRFAWRVLIIRGRLSRLKTRIQIAAKKNQSATSLESQQTEEWTVDLERYKDLLNDCVAWIHERTGIPSSKLLEVATSTPEGEEWGYIYTELKKLEERRVNAVLWTALLSRDQDALMSVGLLPPSESSPPATETERQDSTTDDESDPATTPSAVTLALRNEVESGADSAIVPDEMRGPPNAPTVERKLKRLELVADSINEAIYDEPAAAETPIVGGRPLSLPKEKWPREEYARDAIIRLIEKPKLQTNISAFCRTIAAEQKVPAIAASLKKLLYQPEYQKLWLRKK
jgi:hypothetical protein